MGKPKIITYQDGKPVYEMRPFHAHPAHGGYRVYCKRCKTTTLTGGCSPHDTASAHRCLYNPEELGDADEA